MAGPTIEWLEPKLPDILKNGGGSLGSFAAGEGPAEGGGGGGGGSGLDLSTSESCSFSRVRGAAASEPH